MIIITTRKSKAITEWMRKEEASYSDWAAKRPGSEGVDDAFNTPHIYEILERWGGKLKLTELEAKAIIQSGAYHSTAWDNDDINGGQQTKQTIARIVKYVAAGLDYKIIT